MGAIALGSPWLQRSGFPMGAIALESPWLQSRSEFPIGAIALATGTESSTDRELCDWLT